MSGCERNVDHVILVVETGAAFCNSDADDLELKVLDIYGLSYRVGSSGKEVARYSRANDGNFGKAGILLVGYKRALSDGNIAHSRIS